MKKLFTILAAVCFAGSMMAAALVDGYTKVTDISTLAAGDKVVIYCDDSSTGVTGWNGSKDATVAATGWVEYVVEAATGGVYLKDVTAGKYIALTAKNSFAYNAKASVCKVTATGVLQCTLSGTDYMLYQNGQYYRMYVDKTGNSAYKPFYVYKVLAAGTVTAPSISGELEFAESTTVTMTAAEGAKIYYTLDGTEPTNASTEYTAPFELTETKTVKAIAYEGEKASDVSEMTFVKLQVLTCAEAAAACTDTESADKYVIRGYVTSIVSAYDAGYNNASFWVADAADGGNVLQAFRLYPVATADQQVKVGDYVETIGKLKKYNTTPEITGGTYTIIPAPAPAATVVTVENTTVSEMGQNLVLQGQWNEKAVTISLYPGVTKGFGVYSGEGEGDFWGTIGTADLFANGTDATYTDNGDGSFTFKATMKDATNALYEITMNGLIPVKKTYTIAGSSDAAFGTAWDPSNAENDMFLYSGTIYAWEKYNVTLSAGKIEFKVCEDHAWTTAYPAQNYELTIPADGIYTIMIMFDAASKAIEAFAEKTGEAVVIPTIAMHGNFAGPSDWKDTENFTLAADELTATLVMELVVRDNYEFGMRIGGSGNWTSNGVQFTRENNSAEVVAGNGNLKLVADVAGEYTFTWTYATNTLAITFPAKEEPQPVATWDEIVFTEVAAAGTLDGAVFASATNAAFTLTLVDGDGKLVVDANEATYGTAEENATYTHRLKIGGKTSAKRSMTLAIPADGKLRVAARSSSSSDETRTLVIKQGDVELYNQVVKDADKVDGRYPYAYADVKKGTVTIELPVNALNFYAFGFQAVAGPTVGFENIEATEKAVKFIENGQIFILRDGAVFNLMGARVK